ncbi:hypothetical protein [Microbispora bryophytorum]|uniref:hypothetical protein n=1 Tax=Microbispora bryophytorum TaxID=1460882 RepID=UPI0016684068|nr:hypothetical protein [Microbispora bryophytorum]
MAPPAVGVGAAAALGPPFGSGLLSAPGADMALIMGPLLAVGTGPWGAGGEDTGGVAVPPGVAGGGVAGRGGAELSARLLPVCREVPAGRSALVRPDRWPCSRVSRVTRPPVAELRPWRS